MTSKLFEQAAIAAMQGLIASPNINEFADKYNPENIVYAACHLADALVKEIEKRNVPETKPRTMADRIEEVNKTLSMTEARRKVSEDGFNPRTLCNHQFSLMKYLDNCEECGKHLNYGMMGKKV